MSTESPSHRSGNGMFGKLKGFMSGRKKDLCERLQWPCVFEQVQTACRTIGDLV